MSADFPAGEARTPLREQVLSAAAWASGLTWAISGATALMAVQTVLPPDRIDGLTRLYTRGQLFAVGTRVRYVTSDALDPARPYMFVQNHVNHLDHCTMYAGSPHFKQGLENEDHFRFPFYGWFMKQRGTLPVKRGARDQLGSLEALMAAEVARGHSLLVFPEGTRTRTGEVGRFRTGAFVIAQRLGLAVVPVSVCGMFEVMNANSRRIRPGRTATVYTDAPRETARLRPDEIPAFAEALRAHIQARVAAHPVAAPGR